MAARFNLDYDDRLFDPNTEIKKIARELYESVKDLPIISFHGHVDAKIFSENKRFPNPTELIIIPDHYIFRLLNSIGVSYEDLGIPRKDGSRSKDYDPKKTWKLFAQNYHALAGTPMAQWFEQQLAGIFEIKEGLNEINAEKIYSQIDERLASPEFLPRSIYQRSGIEVLCTTDEPWDKLESHKEIKIHPEWKLNVIPGFRPDKLMDLSSPQLIENIAKLAKSTGGKIENYEYFKTALQKAREYFKSLGAVLTDHGVVSPRVGLMDYAKAEELFLNALNGKTQNISLSSVEEFRAHMLMEDACMSACDGLVMQIHAGVCRNHDAGTYDVYGPDKGFDMPTKVEFVENLRPLLNEMMGNCKFKVVVYCQDSDAYYRELVPLAGCYPSLYLGENWWMFDEAREIERTLEQTLGRGTSYLKKAGFPDDTRAPLSIPVRHDTARRAYADSLAKMVVRKELAKKEALTIIKWLSYYGPKEVFNLN
ncbi:glucuronate isomerase [Candidatus Woesearchaeota archaeon]|nr:glucuronate isomerase [Candidatus Woesearchaeota archaeon]